MKILVTGADGFVGSRLVPKLLAEGHEPVAAVHPASGDVRARFGPAADRLTIVPLEIVDAGSVRAVLTPRFDAVVHLAALASGADARKDPAGAWRVNAVGTALLAEELAREHGREGGTLLLVSTAEVYGVGPPVPRRETDPTAPCSPYAASKLGAEIAALDVHRRTGLPVVIARSFAHTGAGQSDRYVVPALAARIRLARKAKAPAVRVGNLSVVREILHVDDVVAAYLRLLAAGAPGEVYNVAAGQAVSLEDLYSMLCDLIGYRPVPEPHPSLMRTGDIPYLVGDGSKLRDATGWKPGHTLEETLHEVVDAQAD